MPIRLDPDKYEIDALLEYTGSLAGKRVLEVGAGDGRLTWRYAAQAAHVTAIDPDAESIASALESIPAALQDRVDFHPVGVAEFEPPAGSPGFDMVLLPWSL